MSDIARWTEAVHLPGYDCVSCPDHVRDTRGCSKPRACGRAFPAADAKGCVIEEIEPWYWGLCDEARHRRLGWVPEPPDAMRAHELELLARAQAEAQDAARKRAQRVAEQRAAAQRASKK